MSDPFVKDKLGLAGMLLSRGQQVQLGLHVEGKVDEEREPSFSQGGANESRKSLIRWLV